MNIFKLKYNHSGFTLIETMTTMVVLSILFSMASGDLLMMQKGGRAFEDTLRLIDVRKDLLQLIVDDRAWVQTVNYDGNQSFDCVRTGTNCLDMNNDGIADIPVITRPFSLLGSDGLVFYDGQDATAGFDKNGVRCSGFQAIGFSPCIYHVELVWKPICLDTCLKPLAEISVTIRINESAATRLNASNYNFKLQRDFIQVVPAVPPGSFISTWQTTVVDEAITLPLPSGFVYNAQVDWGDGSPVVDVTAWNDLDASHIYNVPGIHTVTISGTMEAWSFANAGDKDKILAVMNLGDVGWKSFNQAFMGCANLTTVTGGNTSLVTNMHGMFMYATNVLPDTGAWDTSSVTDMAHMFDGTLVANPDVSTWNTSSVTNMDSMFNAAIAANPNVSAWDVSKVTNMYQMFRLTQVANPNVSAWNTSSVTTMECMFSRAQIANPDVSAWDTSKVTNMANMFNRNPVANPNVGAWDVSKVTTMANMFNNAVSANPNINAWDVSKVQDMSYMFYVDSPFIASLFNPDMSNWNFASVTNMDNMLTNATSFTKDNYSNMLIRIEATTTNAQVNVALGAGNTNCNLVSQAARDHMTGTHLWIITDGGCL